MHSLNKGSEVFKFITIFILVLSGFVARAAVFKCSENGFQFEYDDTAWELVPQAAATGADVDKKMAEKTLVTVQRKLADTKYHSRFSIVTDNAERFAKEGKSLLESYRDHAAEFLKEQRFQSVSTQEAKLSKVATPAFELTGNQRDFGLKFHQLVFLKDETAYLLTVAARSDKFEIQAAELQKFFDTFQFTQGKKP